MTPSKGALSRSILLVSRLPSHGYKGTNPNYPSFSHGDKAEGQNQWYHFGVGAPPILDVHWGVRFGF